MVGRDRKRFAGLMAALAEVFDQGNDLSEIKMRIYWEALKEYEIQDIERGVGKMLKGRVYPSFPKPAEIIKEIRGNSQEQGMMAWIDVKKAIEHLGHGDSVQFSNPVIHSVIEAMGGWVELCLSPRDELHWKEKEFLRLYEVLSAHGGKHPEYLAGQHEIHNRAHGHSDYIPAPVYIAASAKRDERIMKLTMANPE